MTGARGIGARAGRPLAGLVRRRAPETTRASVLVLGLLIVFLLSMAHDEIAERMVSQGWISEGAAERVEILIGLVLFAVWSVLTVALVDLFRRPAPSRTTTKPGGEG